MRPGVGRILFAGVTHTSDICISSKAQDRKPVITHVLICFL